MAINSSEGRDPALREGHVRPPLLRTKGAMARQAQNPADLAGITADAPKAPDDLPHPSADPVLDESAPRGREGPDVVHQMLREAAKKTPHKSTEPEFGQTTLSPPALGSLAPSPPH